MGIGSGESSVPQQRPDQMVRDQLIGKLLNTTEYSIGNGRIAVDSFRIDLKQSVDQPIKQVAIYMSGLPHMPQESTAGDPQEAALIADVLINKVDSVVILKPEGLNNEAYRDEGKARGQSRIAEAAWRELKVQFKDIKDFSQLEFTLYGYSEGTTQAASLALKLLKEGNTVNALYAFEPCGVAGYPSQDKAKIYPQLIKKLKDFWEDKKSNTTQPVTKTSYGHHISKDLLVGYSTSLQERSPIAEDVSHDMKDFFARFISGPLGKHHPREFVSERLKAAWSVNPAFKALLESGIPLRMFLGTQSEIIPVDDVRNQVIEWRNKKLPAYLMTSQISHVGPNSNPLAMGFLLKLNPYNPEDK